MIELVTWDDNVVTEDSAGRILKRLKLEKNLTSMQLADRSMLSITTIHKVEQGRNVTLHTLTYMLDALGYELVVREKNDGM